VHWLKNVADKANLPVTTTLLGLGAFDETDPKSLHMLGMHGSAYANLAIQSADVIIAVGARFDDRVTGLPSKFAPAARKAEEMGRGGIIQFDIMAKNIDKVIRTTHAVEGDVGQSLSQLAPLLKYAERRPWFDTIAHWKQQYPWESKQSLDGPIRPLAVIAELERQLSGRKHEVIMSTGIGQHQMFAAQHYRWTVPNTFITSGGLGTMGFGLPAAIGVKVAHPDKIVIDVDGDASLQMTVNELATMAEYGLGVKVLVLNNEFQGMVKQWQDLFYDERHCATRMKNPDFVKVAEAYGCVGLRCTEPARLPDVIAEFLRCDKPVVLDVMVDKKEHVYPMVPAGKALHEMVVSNGLQVTL
jgi:acetolactate synthase-1/2/3 large subunit